MAGNKKGKIGLNIIIPSYRAEIYFLSSIFELEKPEYLDVLYILVIDNPAIEISSELNKLIDKFDVCLAINKENLGAAGARNVGIDLATKEWILFLDDDIVPEDNLLFVYGEVLKQSENNIGYFGVTMFPKPINSFTKGIITSDILTFFSIARYVDKLSWGVTANLLIRRSSIGEYRFQNIFPKFGGGEDIDFCLRITKRENKKFKSVPEAIVHHPWWMNGKRSYTRFQRWAFGDSRLPNLHPEHKYRNFPNIMELILFAIIFTIVYGILMRDFWIFPITIGGILIGEYIGEYGKLLILGKTRSPILALESVLIRASNDFGRLKSNMLRGHITGITERFDYFCDGVHIRSERMWALIKLISIGIVILGIVIL